MRYFAKFASPRVARFCGVARRFQAFAQPIRPPRPTVVIILVLQGAVLHSNQLTVARTICGQFNVTLDVTKIPTKDKPKLYYYSIKEYQPHPEVLISGETSTEIKYYY